MYYIFTPIPLTPRLYHCICAYVLVLSYLVNKSGPNRVSLQVGASCANLVLSAHLVLSATSTEFFHLNRSNHALPSPTSSSYCPPPSAMHTILYSVIFVALQCVHLIRGTQSQTRQVLDTEFSNYVERLRDVWGVKGVAMGVVKPGGDVEFGAWGVRSEDGEPMTPDVRPFDLTRCYCASC